MQLLQARASMEPSVSSFPYWQLHLSAYSPGGNPGPVNPVRPFLSQTYSMTGCAYSKVPKMSVPCLISVLDEGISIKLWSSWPREAMWGWFKA